MHYNINFNEQSTFDQAVVRGDVSDIDNAEVNYMDNNSAAPIVNTEFEEIKEEETPNE